MRQHMCPLNENNNSEMSSSGTSLSISDDEFVLDIFYHLGI